MTVEINPYTSVITINMFLNVQFKTKIMTNFWVSIIVFFKILFTKDIEF